MSTSLTQHVDGRSLRRAGSLLALACCAWLAVVSGAQAFSDKARFEAPAGAGGSAGRYFTGSPIDGFACGVCHQGGVEPHVRVLGLPVDGYVPGVTYDVQVTWENPAIPQGLHLELLGRDGRSPGIVALLDDAALGPAERCNSRAGDRSAAYDFSPNGRKVLGVEACGASSLRFRFTAPDAADLAFAMSIVSSDKTGTPEGDGVLSVHRILRRVGEPARTGDCSALAGTARGSLPAWMLATALVLWLRRRRFSETAAPSSR